MSTIDERRAAVQAKLAELSAANDARTEAESAEREVADLEALLKLRIEHGDELGTLETDLGLIVVRRPSSVEFRKFQDKGKFDSQSTEMLVRPCVLHPSKVAVDSMLNARPGILVELADLVVGLAQARSKAREGKSLG